MTDDAPDYEVVEEQTKKEAERLAVVRRQQRDDFRAVMSSALGRRFVWTLIEGRAAAGGQSFVAGGPEGDRSTAFNEGQRSIGIGLRADAQRWERHLYLAMVREQLDALAEAKKEPEENS